MSTSPFLWKVQGMVLPRKDQGSWGIKYLSNPCFTVCLLCPALCLWRDEKQLQQCLSSEAFSVVWKSQELHL